MSAHLRPVAYVGKSLQFESLLTDLSSTPVINIPTDRIPPSARTTQQTFYDVLGLDYSKLAQWDEAAGLFVVTHSSIAEDDLSVHRFTRHDIPWVSERIFRGEIVHFNDQLELSEQAVKDIKALFHTKVRSATLFPLRIGEQILGFLCFGTTRTESEWPEPFKQWNFIADLLVDALTRNNFDAALIRSQKKERLEADERLRRIVESFPTAAILTDDKGKIVLLSSGMKDVFGYERNELSGESIEMLIPQHFRENYSNFGPQAAARLDVGPLSTAQAFDALRKDGSKFQVDVTLTRIQTSDDLLILNVITDITGRKLSEQALIDMNARLLIANEQNRKMKEQLEHENIYLKREIKLEANHIEVIGQSQGILKVLMNAEKVATTDSAVLLLGETGTGKELVARAIHRSSKRNTRAMVNVNCAALPASLVENELFGRERGAYTGALTREIGRFELADRSTIFLDEVGELPLELQAKLLRVLQEGEFERLGSSKTIHVNVRLIAATSRDLEAAVREGKFREDLYYRLDVFPIRVPPLRERREDIPMLTWHFLRELGGRMGRDIETVRASTMKAFQSYSWPGNVRELRNVIERSLIIHPGPVFEAELPEGIGTSAATGTTIEELERNHIFRMLQSTSWRIRGPGGAAEALGLKPTTLEARMKKLGVVRKLQA